MTAETDTRGTRTALSGSKPRRGGWMVVVVVVVLLAVELVLGWSALIGAFHQLRTPHAGWLGGALVAELASMGTYARMQRALLRGAGTKVAMHRHVATTYAAHSLSVTLPGGPVFSTSFNFRQMRRFGASAAVASWCIALSGVLSAGALVVIGVAGGILTRSTGTWSTLAGYLVAALVIAVAARLIAHHPQWLRRPVRLLLGAVNRLRHRSPEHGRDRLVGFVAQLRAIRVHPASFTLAALLAVANWLLDALCLWMCCIAVGGTGITAVQLVIVYCAGMAAASVPIVPGGLGIVDGALVFGLAAGGLASSTAVAAVVLYRLISFGFIIGIGWLIWLAIRYRHRDAVVPPRDHSIAMP